MATAIGSPSQGLIVELGPGTGPVTRSLIEAGVAPERLVLVEYDPGFCRLLKQRFAPAASSKATPMTCRARSRHSRASRSRPSSPVCRCSTSRRPGATKLIADAFALMGLSGVFVQFTYGLLSPIPREVCANLYSAVRSRPILLNLPPAFVWTYRLDVRSADAAKGR